MDIVSSHGAVLSNGMKNAPDDLGREPFTFQKTGQAPAAGLRLNGPHRPELFLRGLFRRLMLLLGGNGLRDRLTDDLAVYPFTPQFLLDPATAETPKPQPAPRPLFGEPGVVDVP